MTNKKSKLSNFILEQLSEMNDNIQKNFPQNMEKRKDNPFLVIDERINSCMGLGRSTDSQLGNRMQNIVFYSARLKYGDESIPNIVSIAYDENIKTVKCTCYHIPMSKYDVSFKKEDDRLKQSAYKQVVFIGKEFSKQDISKKLGLTPDGINNIIVKKHNFEKIQNKHLLFLKKHNSKRIEIDLLIFNSSIQTFEIKLGGGLDTKNAPANIEEIKRLKSIFAFSAINHTYFATCYGEGSDAVSKSFDNSKLPFDKNDKILKNVEFWNIVLPDEISHEEFISIYKNAFENASINNTLKRLSKI